MTDSATQSLGWFLALFAIPALPLRYGINFGTAGLSAIAGVAIVATSLWLGWNHRLLTALAVATAAGALGAGVAVVLTDGYPEARLLAAAAAFVLAAAACLVLDRRTAPHETDRT